MKHYAGLTWELWTCSIWTRKWSRWQKCLIIFKLRMVAISSMMISFLAVKFRTLLSVSRSMAIILLFLYLLMEHNFIRTRNLTLGFLSGFLTTSLQTNAIRKSGYFLVPSFLGPTSPKLLTPIYTMAYTTSLLFSAKTTVLGFVCGMQPHPELLNPRSFWLYQQQMQSESQNWMGALATMVCMAVDLDVKWRAGTSPIQGTTMQCIWGPTATSFAIAITMISIYATLLLLHPSTISKTFSKLSLRLIKITMRKIRKRPESANWLFWVVLSTISWSLCHIASPLTLCILSLLILENC